jgi:type I restriction enzyme R subunit
MTFDPSEKHQSQIPALQLLVALGWQPLTQPEAIAKRGSRLRNVVLDDVLEQALLRINRFNHRGREYPFDLSDAHEAMRRLKPTPDRIKGGLRGANQEVYDALVLGTTITKTIDGDSKSYSFRFIDWVNPSNNSFHVTAEFAVERTGSTQTRRCDIVCFVNGIPFVVIENKGQGTPLKNAVSQLIAYQGEDNVPHLFHFAQMLVAMKRTEVHYAAVGTPAKFWSGWREDEAEEAEARLRPLFADDLSTETADQIAGMLAAGENNAPKPPDLAALVNTPLSAQEAASVFSGDFAASQAYFAAMAHEGVRVVTEQDRAIAALCTPERLLDLVRRFTVFDGGVRKIARHQQYFGILAAIERVRQRDNNGARKGGVIWHTQGSGKSLTMVMLARALALDPAIANPRIVIVTDRDDLDKQIKGTFKSCDLTPVRATSGAHLAELLASRIPLITTIVNKFDNALKTASGIDDDPNLFVLVDESHRTQTGKLGGTSQFASKMRRLLPRACYLGFTGTPLLKKDKSKNDRSTFGTFGALIHKYAIDEAVRDRAVVPLLYEGRLVEQQVSGNVIDTWFDKISQGLTVEQRADLKRKFSRMDALAKTGQTIRAKAFDISEHYRQHWQGTGFKAQLVAPSKAAAVRFKEELDEIGHVSSEIIISAPDEKEGNEEIDKASKDIVRAFWDKMMERFNKSEDEYNRQIVDAFQASGDPEILIVVSKLLTGFDAPRNTVLYLCKRLTEHNLLQAIARVNRLYEDDDSEKDFGYIIDYEGLLGELDQALTTYSALDGFEQEEVVGTVHDVRTEIDRLRQLHDQLWHVFAPVKNKKDMEALEVYLGDDPVREEFYERLRAFGRCLHIAMSSDKVFDVYTEDQLDMFKRDWKTMSKLRQSVQLRYQETVDLKHFEPKIQKLLDDHVTAAPAEVIIELVNINDPVALNAAVEDSGFSEASRADRIASATRRTITERMDEDPAFYQRFSELLAATIAEYRAMRLSQRDFLTAVADIATQVSRRDHGASLPEKLRGNDDGKAFFGVLDARFSRLDGTLINSDESADIALALIDIIKSRRIVDLWSNELAQNDIRNAIDDYVFDTLRGEMALNLTTQQIDLLEQDIMRLARARFPV